MLGSPRKIEEQNGQKQRPSNQSVGQLKILDYAIKNAKKPSLRNYFLNTDVEIFSMRFDPEDELLAAGCSDGTLRIYNIQTNKQQQCVNTFMVDENTPTTSVRWRPTGHCATRQVLVTTNSDGAIIHWHAQTGKILHRMVEENHSIMCLDYNSQGDRFATAGKDFHIRVYDDDTKSVIIDLQPADWNQAGHANRVFALKFTQDDPNIVLSSGWDSNLHIWDLRVKESVGSFYGPSVSGDALDYKDGQILTGSYRNKDQIQLWDLGTRKFIDQIKWDTTVDQVYIYTCQFSKRQGNKDVIVGASGQNEVRIFDAKSGYKPSASVAEIKDAVYTVDFSLKDDKFVFGGAEGVAYIMDYNK